MRRIGVTKEKSEAARFSDYLYSCDIDSTVEPGDGGWEIWVHDDDDLAAAATAFEEFVTNPKASEFIGAAKKPRNEAPASGKGRHKSIDVRTEVWGRSNSSDGTFFLTVGLVTISIGTYLLQLEGNLLPIERIFMIADPWASSGSPGAGPLPEVRAGQVWRLLTPVFLHFGILHIVFNMMWLADLGRTVESHHGSLAFGALVLVFALGSNIAQYIVSGPMFGGMSGVVYGLFGYAWLRARHDVTIPYALHSQTVVMMIVWFFVCLTGVVGPIANTAHAVGLVLGLILGRTGAWRAAGLRRAGRS